MTDEVTQAEARAEDALDLWFFKDLSDDQRRSLFYHVFGDKIAEEAKSHGLQRLCLKRIVMQIGETARAALAQETGDD